MLRLHRSAEDAEQEAEQEVDFSKRNNALAMLFKVLEEDLKDNAVIYSLESSRH